MNKNIPSNHRHIVTINAEALKKILFEVGAVPVEKYNDVACSIVYKGLDKTTQQLELSAVYNVDISWYE